MVETDDVEDDGTDRMLHKALLSAGSKAGQCAPYTVLLVEDDLFTCRLLAESLKSCQYNGKF